MLNCLHLLIDMNTIPISINQRGILQFLLSDWLS